MPPSNLESRCHLYLELQMLYKFYLIQGYVIYSMRNKLKKQYAHLKGPQLKNLKVSGIQVVLLSDLLDFILFN